LQGEVLEKQLAYWKQQLGGNLPVVQLPTVRPRESVKTSRGATTSFVIPANLSAALLALSRQEGVTLFMTLLAAFQILLQRYTNQDDIVVGTDVANRNRAEIESLIGFFVNLLVLRTDLSGNPSFWELLKRVREITLGAYAHQDLPFDKLVEVLRPDRQSSHTPLFQVLFVLQNAPMTTLELPGLTLSQLEIEEKITRFDLALFVIETSQGIEGMWQYNAGLFDSTTIKRMSGHFETLLNSIVAQPNARINSLEMLSDAEKEQQAVKKREQKASKLKKFMAVQPKAVDLSQDKLIETGSLQPGQTLPLTITPKVDDVDIVDWAKSNREFIETKLLHHGAILFRNFGVPNAAHFESLANAICPGLFGEYGDLPREGVSGKVYGSTPYPSEQAILFHNESSHMHCWPQKIWFLCVQPAQKGGETLIVDCRKVLQMLAPKLREKFASKQLMYVRNYTDGLDVSWQDFFHTNDKAEVEEYCRKASISVEWKPDGGLKTRQVRPAIIKHPKTGEPVFFNQIQLHHASYLKSEVRKSLMSLFGEENLPRHVYYGDGFPIEESVIEEIFAIYKEATVSFPWQQGDVLMLDNMLTAHGRNPYVGFRKIVVAMGEMVHSADTQRNV
jgi:alpha-ketoglutarate-dependent taurine dioxygenase